MGFVYPAPPFDWVGPTVENVTPRPCRSRIFSSSIISFKTETYTADGVDHKTFSIKAHYIRKIDYSASSDASASKAAKPAKKAK